MTSLSASATAQVPSIAIDGSTRALARAARAKYECSISYLCHPTEDPVSCPDMDNCIDDELVQECNTNIGDNALAYVSYLRLSDYFPEKVTSDRSPTSSARKDDTVLAGGTTPSVVHLTHVRQIPKKGKQDVLVKLVVSDVLGFNFLKDPDFVYVNGDEDTDVDDDEAGSSEGELVSDDEVTDSQTCVSVPTAVDKSGDNTSVSLQLSPSPCHESSN